MRKTLIAKCFALVIICALAAAVGCAPREKKIITQPIVAPPTLQISRKVTPLLDAKRLTPEELTSILSEKTKKGFRTNPLSGMPMFFESGSDAADSGVYYRARRPGYGVYLRQAGLSVAFLSNSAFYDDEVKAAPGVSRAAPIANLFSMDLRGARSVQPEAERYIKGRINNIQGQGRLRNQKQDLLPVFLRYPEVYAGVDLFLLGQGEELHYGFEVAPEGTTEQIRWDITGADRLSLGREGDLLIHLGRRVVRNGTPQAFEKLSSGKLRPLRVAYKLLGRNTVGFEISGQRTAGTTLYIDPVLVFATYFGGTGQDGSLASDGGASDIIRRSVDLTVGSDGRLYLIGTTTSADLPVSDQTALVGSSDAFVLALEVQGSSPTLSYATYIGGSSSERGRGITARPDGSVFICGHSSSTDFPVSENAVNPARNQCGGYIARLAPDGSFVAGTYVGGSCSYHPNAIVFESANAVDNQPRIYVTGAVLNTGMPQASIATAGAFQTEHGGNYDAFVGAYRPNLDSQVYFTFLGGANTDIGMDIAVSDGYAFVTGATASPDFPVNEIAAQTELGSLQTQGNCNANFPNRSCFDAFVTRLNRAGSELLYSTFYGHGAEDFGRGIDLDNAKRAYITGATSDRVSTGTREIFTAKVEAGGGSVLNESFVAASGNDHGERISVDSQGRSHIVGTISRDGLATGLQIVQPNRGGGNDMFYSRSSASGVLEYFTYYGGSGSDRGDAIDTVATGSDAQVCVFMAGASGSTGLATAGALFSEPAAAPDILIAALCDLPFDPSLPGNFSKTTSTTSVSVGQQFSFSITVVNTSDEVATGVVITDTIANDLQIVGVSPGCHIAGQEVSCSLTVPPGSTSVLIQVQVRPEAACPHTINNTAHISVLGFSHSASSSVLVSCPAGTEPCGSGFIGIGEICEEDAPVCGNGIVETGEQCDDGNSNNSDSCSNTCRLQVPAGEQCGFGSDPCPAGLVCGKTCSLVEECWLFIFCDSYELCTLPACIPNTPGVRIVPN